jgi:hypothetical protein
MQDSSLQAQLAESKAEVARLRDHLSTGIPIVHKDLSLVSLVPRLSGAESAISLEEFLDSVDNAAQLGRWTSSDCVRVAVLKLAEPAKSFYNTSTELHNEAVNWETFKKVFRQCFRDARTDQFHFLRLQTAKQGKNEGPQEFADRCRALAHKVMRRDNDPTVQKIHEENAERMLLASFVGGLVGEVGKVTWIQNPQNLEQALNTAFAVREAVRHEKIAETFYTKFEDSVRISDRGRDNKNDMRHTAMCPVDRRYVDSPGTAQPPKPSRNVKGRAEFRCYEYKVRRHLARECPTRLKYPSRRSNRSSLPGDEARYKKERGAHKEVTNQGNK